MKAIRLHVDGRHPDGSLGKVLGPPQLSSSFADFRHLIRPNDVGLLAYLWHDRGNPQPTPRPGKEADRWNLPRPSSNCYSTLPRSAPRPPLRPSSPSSPAGSSPTATATSPRSS